MRMRFALFLLFASSLPAADRLAVKPARPGGRPGELAVIQVTMDGRPIDWKEAQAVVRIRAEHPDAGEMRWMTADGGRLMLQPPISLPPSVPSVDYTIAITAQGAGEVKQEFVFTVAGFALRDWESRAIIGWHQAGASSAEAEQNLFFDFFIARPFSGGVCDSGFNLWGQVRVASAPQQRSVPLSQFAVDFTGQLGSVKVNELAQSAEFMTGFEWRPFRKWMRGSGGRVRTIGFVGFFGAKGAFSDPASRGHVFRVPSPDSPQWTAFVSHFPQFDDAAFAASAPYIGLMPPDRERFYRQYGFGIRYTSYDSGREGVSPSMFTLTVGQDQSITRGRYIGPVLKFDAFYPLPWDRFSVRFLYLFGTADLAVAKPGLGAPLALELVSGDCDADAPESDIGVRCGVKLYQEGVAVFAVPSSRDTYRIGVGIDTVGFLKSIGVF
jgi:hypothetical protein